MHRFTRKLLTEWRKLDLPFENAAVVVAVSGGADSVAMALVLSELRTAKKLNLNFIIAHFNHKLRGAAADADAEFVGQLAKSLNFNFVGETWSNAQNRKTNLEQSAREARYSFLRDTAEKENAYIVLTAHTANDQAETLLLNLIRGSGIAGLGAMQTVRDLKTDKATPEESVIRDSQFVIRLVRPLLSWAKREETEGFVTEKGIDFRRDSMNDDEKFSRVKVRKKLIPLLQELNPKIVETLTQTAFILQKDAEYLAAMSDSFAGELTVKELQQLSEFELASALKHWLKEKRGNLRQIGLTHIRAIAQLVSSRKSGRRIELPQGESVVKKGGKLYFEKS